MDAPRVSIIILNWNGWKDTIECLESLYRIDYPNYDVIVVDNGSQDDSIQKIKEYAKGKIEVNSKFFKYNPNNKPIKVFEVNENEAKQGKFNRPLYEKFDVDRRMILIKNKKNYGFTGGNNIGMKFALSVLNPDYVLLLNNDTVVEKDFLKELVKVAESDEKIGIVGPKIYYYDYNGRSDIIQSAGAKINLRTGANHIIGRYEIDVGQYDEAKEVDYVSGACLLVKSGVLKKVGLLDPEYFTYWEETDLCMRVKKAGYKILYAPQAKIWHKESVSWKKSKPVRIYYLNRNKFLFIRKHTTQKQFIAFLIYFFSFGFLFDSGVILLYHRDVKGWFSFLKGVVAFLVRKCENSIQK